MNATNPALDAYIDACRVVAALKIIMKAQIMSKEDWDKMVSRDVQLIMCAEGYVRIGAVNVIVTKTGMDIAARA